MSTTTLTRNLKLRVSSALTADAKYNLERIDSLTVQSQEFVGNLVLVSGEGNELVESTVTLTELEYLSGATSNIQDQIDNIIAGTGGVLGASTDWITADGTSKTFTHSLNSTDVDVTIIDLTDNTVLLVDEIEVINLNTITLTASEAPPPASWRVVVQAKP